MATILITAFASEDLRSDAESQGVSHLLEKPFELPELLRLVNEAQRERKALEPVDAVAVLEATDTGDIVFANDAALDLLRTALGAAAPARLSAVFDSIDADRIELACERWVEWTLCGEEERGVWVRAAGEPDSRILVLLDSDLHSRRCDPRVRRLLGVEEAEQLSWRSEDRVLVLESDPAIRGLYAAQLERIGCVCYKAERTDLALQIFRADPKVAVVIVDYELPGLELHRLLHKLRTIRGETRIVGTSSDPRHHKVFADHGVHDFVDKPWRTGDLVESLRAG